MIQIKNAKELDGMRRANALSAAALKYGGEHIEAGMTTWELDKLIYDFIVKHGGIPNFKGLYGFPGTACISLNDTVIHGIPSHDIVIRPGDIVSIDTGAKVDGYAKDCQYSYQSDKGKINATMTGNQIHFYPVSFSKEELKKMKIDIWEKCKNKIFVNEYGTDSHNHVIYHDWKKQKVCTNFLIKNNETNTYGKVKGESLITPGKYDRLYPDSDMYSIDKVEKYDRKDKMMNEAADLYYNKKGEKSGYFTLYGMILFVFLVLLDLVYTVIFGIPLGVLFLIFDW